MQKILLLPLVLLIGLMIAPATSHACACCGTWKVTNVADNDHLNIRSGPGVRFRVVGAIPPHSACVIKTGQCRGNWCRVAYAEFKGWVSTRYLRWLP